MFLHLDGAVRAKRCQGWWNQGWEWGRTTTTGHSPWVINAWLVDPSSRAR